jgi:L-lactate dehydrogenase complex protein LldG
MTPREAALDRVRRALGRSNASPPTLPPLDLSGIGPSLAPKDYLTTFESEWKKVAGISYRVANWDELEAAFEKILVLAEAHAVILSRNPLLTELGIADRLTALDKCLTPWSAGSLDEGMNSLADFKKASFVAGAGITGVDFVIAESGTLVLSSATERVQVTSLAPPIHVALYRQSQLVGSIDEVLARFPMASRAGGSADGRSVVFITGTSRTADIEQVLIRGVHGPRETHAILVEDGFR